MAARPDFQPTPPEDFTQIIRSDHAAGQLEPLSFYLERHPGHERQVALSWLEAGSVSDDGSDSSGQRVGPYEIEREIGRGGQGIVYLARDRRLDRQVALKVLTRLGPGSGDVLRRFRREAEVASRLDHPGICGIYDAAIEGSIPYIAMRYIRGHSIAEFIRDTKSPASRPNEGDDDVSIISFEEDGDGPVVARDSGQSSGDESDQQSHPPLHKKEILRLIQVFERAARALHAAHEAGVIHRDIKPGNILIAENDQPVILDFGLARDDEGDDASLTKSGDLFGTPAYMSPEQLLAQRVELDRRTDIWSLGVTFYEAFTLRRPFEAPSRQALYQTIMTKEAIPLRKVNSAIPTDLSVVMEMALEKDRDRRYATALELADDLRAVRLFEPIQAKPAGPLQRAWRWTQRNRGAAAMLAVLTLLMVVASALLAYGLGAEDKAQLESELRRQAESKAAFLAQAERDRTLTTKLEEISAGLGMMAFALGGNADYSNQIQDAIDTLSAWGIPLSSDASPEELAQILRETNERSPLVYRTAMSGLYDLEWMLPMAARHSSLSQDLTKQFGDVVQRAVAVINLAEVDPWYPNARQVLRRARETNQPKLMTDLIEGEDLSTLGAEKLGWLAVSVSTMRSMLPRSLELLGMSLEKSPGNFVRHFARGGLQMSAIGAERSKYARPEDIPSDAVEKMRQMQQVADHHFHTALALRPTSGLAWTMVASLNGYRGRFRLSLEQLERATTLSPADPIVWYMKGLFNGFARQWDRSEDALRKALELDPELEVAQRTLSKVLKREPPKWPSQKSE